MSVKLTAACFRGEPEGECPSCAACAACDGSCGACPYYRIPPAQHHEEEATDGR